MDNGIGDLYGGTRAAADLAFWIWPILQKVQITKQKSSGLICCINLSPFTNKSYLIIWPPGTVENINDDDFSFLREPDDFFYHEYKVPNFNYTVDHFKKPHFVNQASAWCLQRKGLVEVSG